MGTNHYWRPRSQKCEHCGHDPVEDVHLGKSSAGWVYALQAFPELGITTLDQLVALMGAAPEIRDEYGDRLTLEEWLSNVAREGIDDLRKLRRSGNGLARGDSWESFGAEFT